MARNKKYPPHDPTAPTLFDSLDLDTGLTDPLPPLPGIRHHIPTRHTPTTPHPTVTPLDTPQPATRINLISFGSGSSGNCTYIGTHTHGLLIDAGIDYSRVENELTRNAIPHNTIQGILLTHDHGDHIRYAYALLRRHRQWALYCTPRVLGGILRRHNISRRIKDYHHPIYKEIPLTIGPFTVTPFHVDHDGTDNVGYNITTGTFNLTIATDLGNISDRADHYLRRANNIIIETNYDSDMLRRGRYPEYLKARIASPTGHMDNTHTATYLADIYTPSLHNIILCHLSNDNNTPDIALHTVRQALLQAHPGLTIGDGTNTPQARKATLQLQALPRHDTTGLITLHRL